MSHFLYLQNGVELLSSTLRSSAERLYVSAVLVCPGWAVTAESPKHSLALRAWCLQELYCMQGNYVSVSSGGSLQLVNASSSISNEESRVSLHLAGRIETALSSPSSFHYRLYCCSPTCLIYGLMACRWNRGKHTLHYVLLGEINVTLSACSSQSPSSHRAHRASIELELTIT